MTQARENPQRGASRSTQLTLPRSAVRVLAACARSEQLCPALGLNDATASGFFEQLAGAGASFGLGELRCSAFRTSVIDELAENFFARNPSGVGVSIWPLLGTRAHRLRARPWLDLDPPPIAALRQRYLPPRSAWTEQAGCLCSAGTAATRHGAARRQALAG